MLKMTGVKLEKISDIDMYLFIEKGLRGGNFCIANNKYMKDYDPKKAMSGYFPYGGFKWLKNIDGFDVTSIGKESKKGFILDVDVEYPGELHALHNDYLLAPEILAVSYEMLSN